MVNLTSEMAQLWASLGPPGPGRGRVVQFVAATHGEGTSTVAREFARFAAGRASRTVFLIDLDLEVSGQHEAVRADPGRFGVLSRAAAATPDGSMFFTVQPPAHSRSREQIPDANYFCARQAGHTNLWVTRFRTEMLRPGQAVQLQPASPFWAAMRRHADWVVIDSPAADRSSAALTIAPAVDDTVLVVAAEENGPRAPMRRQPSRTVTTSAPPSTARSIRRPSAAGVQPQGEGSSATSWV